GRSFYPSGTVPPRPSPTGLVDSGEQASSNDPSWYTADCMSDPTGATLFYRLETIRINAGYYSVQFSVFDSLSACQNGVTSAALVRFTHPDVTEACRVRLRTQVDGPADNRIAIEVVSFDGINGGNWHPPM